MAKVKNLDNLEKQIQKLEAELEVLRKGWAKEIKELSDDPTFDEYSRKGKKKLEEVAEKYVDLIVDAEDTLNGLISEYNSIIDELNDKEKDDKK